MRSTTLDAARAEARDLALSQCCHPSAALDQIATTRGFGNWTQFIEAKHRELGIRVIDPGKLKDDDDAIYGIEIGPYRLIVEILAEGPYLVVYHGKRRIDGVYLGPAVIGKSADNPSGGSFLRKWEIDHDKMINVSQLTAKQVAFVADHFGIELYDSEDEHADRRAASGPARQVQLDKMARKRNAGSEGLPSSLKGSRFTERGLFACLSGARLN